MGEEWAEWGRVADWGQQSRPWGRCVMGQWWARVSGDILTTILPLTLALGSAPTCASKIAGADLGRSFGGNADMELDKYKHLLLTSSPLHSLQLPTGYSSACFGTAAPCGQHTVQIGSSVWYSGDVISFNSRAYVLN